MLFVTKARGIKERFEKGKIVNTCLRMNASVEVAEKVAEKVYKNSYQGIPTSEVLQLIFKFLGEYKPEIKFMIDLKEALSKLKPKPDFEMFIRRILEECSYKVEPGKIIRGKCIEHEIDGIARKGRQVLYLEIKHHFKFHTPTPLEVPLSVWATLQDLKDGFRFGYHTMRFTGALLACNTKFSMHAKKYALCKGIKIFSWEFPTGSGLREVIREKKLYPITILEGLDEKTQEKLVNIRIITLKDLIEADSTKLPSLTKIKGRKILLFIEKARKLLDSFK